MPEPPIETGEDFLQAVADGLPFEDGERIEILEELSAHLVDSIARLRADGMPADRAERCAIERLGPPEDLAKELTNARRHPRRLLAAAGAGAFAIVRAGIWGLLWGLLAVLVGAMVVGSLAQAVAALLRLHVGYFDLVGSGLELVPLPVAAFCAGSALTPAVALRAGYRVHVVRRVAVLATVAVAAWMLWGWSGTLTWPRVVVLLVTPFAWAAGSWHARPFRAAWRQTLIAGVVIAALVLSLPLVMRPTVSDAGSSGTVVGSWTVGSQFDGIAPRAPTDIAAAFENVSPQWSPDSASVFATIASPAILAGWHDLRLEAWAATSPFDSTPTLEEPAAGPFATAPVEWETSGPGISVFNAFIGDPAQSSFFVGTHGAGTPYLDGSIRLDRRTNVGWAIVAVTGIAPDGVRYLLGQPDFMTVHFSGTVWDWFAAISAGQ